MLGYAMLCCIYSIYFYCNSVVSSLKVIFLCRFFFFFVVERTKAFHFLLWLFLLFSLCISSLSFINQRIFCNHFNYISILYVTASIDTSMFERILLFFLLEIWFHVFNVTVIHDVAGSFLLFISKYNKRKKEHCLRTWYWCFTCWSVFCHSTSSPIQMGQPKKGEKHTAAVTKKRNEKTFYTNNKIFRHFLNVNMLWRYFIFQ